MKSQLRVGIVGLQPKRSWASVAHVPALRQMSDLFTIVGVANTSLASSTAAAEAYAIPRAYVSPADLVRDPDVDIVSITVKVPHHLELVKLALHAGKHVYCEWPLGNGLEEAVEIAELANKKGLLGVCGMQALASPEIVYAGKLIADGYIGKVLSTSVVGRGRGWGGSIPLKSTAYVLDHRNGASMLTIPCGHTLAAIRGVLGNIEELSSVLANQRTSAIALDTGEILPMTSHDQVLFCGLMSCGAPISWHFRGGDAVDGKGFFWEINGTDGDLRLTGRSGHTQQVKLLLEGRDANATGMKVLEVPTSYLVGGDDLISGNVARVYARMSADLRNGTHTAPTFKDAVEVHKIIDTIMKSAMSGNRVKVQST